jgi:hypothetical protein
MKELCLEGFDHITGRYYDHVHEAAIKVGPWLSDQQARVRGQKKDKSKGKGQQKDPVSMPSSPVGDYSPQGRRRDEYDDDYYFDGNGRRRNLERDWDERSRRSNRSRARSMVVSQRRQTHFIPDIPTNPPLSQRDRDSQPPPPQIRVDKPPSVAHIYPPPPLPLAPYPTNGALVPMPPDGAYPLTRANTDRGRQDLDYPRLPRLGRARSTGFYDDYYDDRHGYDRRRERSHSRGRRGNLLHYDSRHERDLHIGASLAGAVVGGFIGKKASKGDWKATAAGAVVGALGAGVAEREYERHKRKDEKEEEAWEAQWGRRRGY